MGFSAHAAQNHKAITSAEAVYRTLQLYFLNLGDLTGPVPWQLELSRFMAPIVTIYSVGRAMAVLFDRQLTWLRLRFWTGHVVVLGLGRKGQQILSDHLKSGTRVVAVEQNDDRETHQRCRDDGAIVIKDSATRKESLRAARVAHASRVFVFCGSDHNNVGAVIASSEEVASPASPKRRVDRYVHIVDPELCIALRRHALFPDANGLFRTHVVNTFENAARTLFADRILPYRRDHRRRRIRDRRLRLCRRNSIRRRQHRNPFSLRRRSLRRYSGR